MAKKSVSMVFYYKYEPRIMKHIQHFVDCFDKLEHAEMLANIRVKNLAEKLKRSEEPVFGPNDKIPQPEQLMAIDSYYVILQKFF